MKTKVIEPCPGVKITIEVADDYDKEPVVDSPFVKDGSTVPPPAPVQNPGRFVVVTKLFSWVLGELRMLRDTYGADYWPVTHDLRTYQFECIDEEHAKPLLGYLQSKTCYYVESRADSVEKIDPNDNVMPLDDVVGILPEAQKIFNIPADDPRCTFWSRHGSVPNQNPLA